MPELSFLLAQLSGVLFLFGWRAGLEQEDIALALSVMVPPLLAQAALLLPRLTGSRGAYDVGGGQKILAWIAAFVFSGLTAGFVDQHAGQEKWFPNSWQFAVALAGLEAVYGIYAAWFLQSRVAFNERKASALRTALSNNDFDVFLCHNSIDKPEVKAIGLELMKRGIKPWLDAWDLQPGKSFQSQIEEQIRQVKSAAVFVGADPFGPWQSEETKAFLSACVKRGIPVIPILLPNAPSKPDLPLFLAEKTWVDLRIPEPNPLDQLVFGITGKRP